MRMLFIDYIFARLFENTSAIGQLMCFDVSARLRFFLLINLAHNIFGLAKLN